jgi:pimeloyl-ACP methyl ester carboxylesterase
MQAGNLQFGSSIIHYRTGGQGQRPLICFHGYGEISASFSFLEKTVGASYRIVAIDLPFHGDTQWNEGHLTPPVLADMILQLLKQLQLQSNDIHLIGFSLGGRLALCLLQQIPERISKLVLLAPDGLAVNFWYWLPTQTAVGNSLFKLTMSKPGWFLGMLRFSNRLRLINQSIYKFVEYYIHDDEVRKQLYDRWTGLSKCTPHLKKIKAAIKQHNISMRLLYGKHDRIIGPKKGRKFIDGLDGCNIEVLNCGHQVLHEKNGAAIADALLH